MRQYERSGVHVDQCSECRGIFLDRGELEKLIDAETAFHSAAPAPAPTPAPAPAYDRGYQQPSYPPPSYQQSGYRHQKKRKSFFEELFD
jgi:Zn-finger nucleic acid-binding protein